MVEALTKALLMVAPTEAKAMLEAVREGGLLPAGSQLVAMLSGGRDSVCLLDLAVRLLGPDAVMALHVNYGLRDDADCSFVGGASEHRASIRTRDPIAGVASD